MSKFSSFFFFKMVFLQNISEKVLFVYEYLG
jgi:hypothetical protein